MNIVITMAGLGSRFKKAGFAQPKYMIEAHGKTLFEWSMSSLFGFNQGSTKYIFIVRTEDNASEFIADKCKNFGLNEYKIIEIDYLTDGQAATAMIASKYWAAEEPLLIYNIDTFVEPNEMNSSQIKGDGFIPCFNVPGEHWSFVKLDETGKAIEVREKQKISDNCTLGAYYFKSCKMYQDLYNEYYSKNDNMEKGEKYVAPLYNLLIQKGGSVYISHVSPDKVYVLGTPEELQTFKSKAIY
ncbi:MAG: glycosyltransferase family 2 protein [Deltaproteobacteria bacterium]